MIYTYFENISILFCLSSVSFVFFFLAYLSGVKGNFGTIGVNGKVKKHDCNAGPDNKSKYTESIGKWAYEAGKSIGLVTTTRVTHASPAG